MKLDDALDKGLSVPIQPIKWWRYQFLNLKPLLLISF